MFGFLNLLDLFCALVAIAVVNLFFPPVLFVCRVHIGAYRFLKCFASSGFVFCVDVHSHHKLFFPLVPFFCRA